MLGVWRSTLGSWEAGHYQPEGNVRRRVIEWLGFDPQATSYVIFLPPFYVVHTPGVFENLAAIQCESNQFGGHCK